MNQPLPDQGERTVCSCDYDGVRLCHVMPPGRCQRLGNDQAVAGLRETLIGRLTSDERQADD